MSSTNGLDTMSSPDPLGDPITSSMSRVTRSMARSQTSTQRSLRQGSILASSPRKQTFELDVGNERSPQRILVTVEAEDSASRKTHVNRRLFPPQKQATPRSPVRRKVRTTTTTVPLRGLTDDEGPTGAETPRRRGRPRKSGTPMPSKTGTPMPSTRKRAGSPLESTPRRTRRSVSITADSASEMGDEAEENQETPRPRPRKSPVKRSKTPARKTAAAPKIDAQETGTAKRRGRPRRQALVPAEMEEMAEQDTLTESIPNVIPTRNDETGEQGPNDTLLSTINVSTDGSVAGEDADEEDMWLANLSESRSVPASEMGQSRIDDADPPSTLDGDEEERSRLTSDAPISVATDGDNESDLIDFGAADKSDTESLATESVAQTETDRDTIAQGEDFSMIMMDSIVSFRESRQYREESLPEMGEATSFIVDRALESIRHAQPDDGHMQLQADQATGQQDELTPNAANGVEEVEEDNLLQLPTESTPTITKQLSGIIDNRSKTLSNSPRRGKTATPLSRQLAIKSLRQDESLNETPLASRAARADAAREESTLYDDSFSEIPDAVLEAATPRPPRKRFQDQESAQDEAYHVEERSSDGALEDYENDAEEATGPSRDNSVELVAAAAAQGPLSDTGSMLLTPEETPSPANDDVCVEEPVDEPVASDVAEEDLRSSPPLLRLAMSTSGASDGRHMRHNSTETPVDPSPPEVPSVPPVAVAAADRLDLPSQTARPPLSPIVRAGRALQTVTSDPPSPKGRESLLRSPFRSSTTRDSQEQQSSSRQSITVPEHDVSEAPQSPPVAAAPEPQSTQRSQRSWAQTFNPMKQIKNIVSQGAQMFSSPKFTIPQGMDDPFGPDPDMPKPTASRRQAQVPVMQEQARIPEPETHSVAANDTLQEDGMDWEPSESPTEGVARRARSASASSVFTNGASAQAAPFDAESDADDAMATEAELQNPNVQSEAVDMDDTEEEEDEDEDIWAIEAERPIGSPRKVTQVQDPTLNRWGTGKSPSPWTKAQNEPSFHETDDFSLLSVHGRDASQLSQSRQNPQSFEVSAHAVPARRVDLSTFFSSPAVVPGMQLYAEEDTATEKSPVRQREARENIQLSSVRQKAFQPNNGQSRSNLFSPAPFRPASQTQYHQSLFAPSSAASTRQQQYAQVPQKRNFAPFLSKPSVNVTNSLFGTANTYARSQSASSQVSGAIDEESHEDHEDTHEASIIRDDEEADESSFIAPILKPLPERTASPTKSCLRSPLKPKTPGPVVEFSTSTLSPLEQEEARARREREAYGYDHDDQSDVQPTRTFNAGECGDKENTTSTSRLKMLANKAIPKLTPSSSSLRQPLSAPKATSSSAPLSRTEWTKAHWIQMDLLLQERRRGSLDFQLQHRGVGLAQRRRSAALLGKLVSAQGESMALEQWHLDVVDAFRSDLCGGDDTLFCAWDEHVLAKRLFALLVGEGRRKQKKALAGNGTTRTSAFAART
ncbi:hypothetical protein MCOR02_008585 [Pyricularia oryzae]|uniref:Uncharacterized protein n=1 Tax=Pyricularia oryzae TaxID=318829 RepID=A0A4P7NGJ0_PYROR|nr:hypothetical protein MCOR02_008585 [Pyricularia oryzae]KAI6269622.1 hypothetical protein MCOR26_008625 [Pyricularia oryzae]KAI6305802.1 hypothetical protein MCOR34_008344 [Pyricularia oryzae]KAI6348708.1 hypothetical protein MCOR28_001445 [Pyricularia oryzae]KAI6509516.1 hypothetical protein MCOR13_001629 [Pyricularia oryzae]